MAFTDELDRIASEASGPQGYDIVLRIDGSAPSSGHEGHEVSVAKRLLREWGIGAVAVDARKLRVTIARSSGERAPTADYLINVMRALDRAQIRGGIEHNLRGSGHASSIIADMAGAG